MASEDKPPITINGKRNPAYSAWYYATHREIINKRQKAWLERDGNREKANASKRAWLDRDGNRARENVKVRERYWVRSAEDYEDNEHLFKGNCKCLECKMVFNREQSVLNGFRFFYRYTGLCPDCQGVEREY